MHEENQALFWDVAANLLEEDGVTKSTMMGYPCLRVEGNFFASVQPQSGNLIVKLPKARVAGLIEAGEGLAFAPNGRQFKEWVQFETRHRQHWLDLMTEAKAFVQ